MARGWTTSWNGPWMVRGPFQESTSGPFHEGFFGMDPNDDKTANGCQGQGAPRTPVPQPTESPPKKNRKLTDSSLNYAPFPYAARNRVVFYRNSPFQYRRWSSWTKKSRSHFHIHVRPKKCHPFLTSSFSWATSCWSRSSPKASMIKPKTPKM